MPWMTKPILSLSDWTPVVDSIVSWMRSIAGAESVAAALGKLPPDIGDTNLDWLSNILGTEAAGDPSALSDWLARDFAGIRCFHGTRLLSSEELSGGLRLLDSGEMQDFA